MSWRRTPQEDDVNHGSIILTLSKNFFRSLKRLKQITTLKLADKPIDTELIFVEDVVFSLLEVGNKLENAVKLLNTTCKQVDRDELSVITPMSKQFFKHLRSDQPWSEVLTNTEKRRAFHLVENVLKQRKLAIDSELSDVVKEFVILVVTMKEMSNSLIMTTNNLRDNRIYYPKSLLELHTMKTSVENVIRSLVSKLASKGASKNLLGKYESTSLFKRIRLRNSGMYKVYKAAIDSKEVEEPETSTAEKLRNPAIKLMLEQKAPIPAAAKQKFDVCTQFVQAVQRLKKCCPTTNPNNKEWPSDQVFIEDAVFILLQVGYKLETSCNLFKTDSTGKLELDDLSTPMKPDFFAHLDPKLDWNESLNSTEKRRAQSSIGEVLKMRNMSIKDDLSCEMKKFASIAIGLKEITNNMILRTNECKEGGAIRNKEKFDKSRKNLKDLFCLILQALKNLGLEISPKQKLSLGKYEHTSVVRHMRLRKCKTYKAFVDGVKTEKIEAISLDKIQNKTDDKNKKTLEGHGDFVVNN